MAPETVTLEQALLLDARAAQGTGTGRKAPVKRTGGARKSAAKPSADGAPTKTKGRKKAKSAKPKADKSKLAKPKAATAEP
jgi:hypothetical protein